MNGKLLRVAIAIMLSFGGAWIITGSSQQVATAQEGMSGQDGVLIGYGGQIFGLVNVESNGHSTKISAATDLIPKSNMVFEAWLTDGNYAASGYPLSLGQFIRDGTLSYNENLVNAFTFTDITVTMEPRDDKDPKPAWSNAVGAYLLVPPFGQ
jgi:hypothetical protein